MKVLSKIILIQLACLILFFTPVLAEDIEDTLAYKLAILHLNNLNPLEAFLGNKEKPTDALTSEFKWILDSLSNRCLNPDETIADTIIETWQNLRKNGHKTTILETARELMRITKNVSLFGTGKVNFRMTSQYWLYSKIYKIAIQNVINSDIMKQR